MENKKITKNSLVISLIIIFVISFGLYFYVKSNKDRPVSDIEKDERYVGTVNKKLTYVDLNDDYKQFVLFP